jgi:prolyl-tRNA synthetase
MKWSKLNSEGPQWPPELADYEVLVCLLEPSASEVAQSAEIVYRELRARGLKVLFDDLAADSRAQSQGAPKPGVPVQINVGSRDLERGEVELIIHSACRSRNAPLEDVADLTLEVVRELKRL